MSDPRANIVECFRAAQRASRVFVLTVLRPFTVGQDRFMVVEMPLGAQLVICQNSTPRTALEHGSAQPLDPAILTAFLCQISAADSAWHSDSIPVGIHDGITFTFERADVTGYQRARIIDPQPGSRHAQLLAAWALIPEVKRALP